jgi:predicted flavoprotein YhiN
LQRQGHARILLDLKPDMEAAALARRLAATPAADSAANRLRKGASLGPPIPALLHEGVGASFATLGPAALAALLKAIPIDLVGQDTLDRAISSAGGLSRAALDDRLMLERIPGVFACGEMLDWEAPTGGYLLQACFATGFAAAEGVLSWLGRSGE